VGVVLAARGYPDNVETGTAITGIEDAARTPGAVIFHAGTRREQGRLVTSGGRVLTVVGRGESYRDAVDVAYRAAARIQFEGMQFRSDIGRKAMSASAR
jgi:phosphoribosylamine--glycine ligase